MSEKDDSETSCLGIRNSIQAIMSQLRLFLVVLLPFLSLLPLTATSHCEPHASADCKKHASFVPGHNFIGEGVDITSLERKGAFVVDISKWQGPNGTCTLCRNRLMRGQWQKLPLVGEDWRERQTCRRQATNFVDELDMDVANAAAQEIGNDWKMEFAEDLKKYWKQDLGLSNTQVVFTGSRSQMTLFAHQKSHQDRYSFLRREIECEYYSLRLQQSPLLSSHFVQAIDRLPHNYDPEEYQHFINIYGTHYMNRVHLGGRARFLVALKTCAMALMGFTAEKLKECLDLEASLRHNGLSGFFSLSSECDKLWVRKTRGNFYDMYSSQHVEVVGGHKQMLFSDSRNMQLLTEWMETTKTTPGLISYSVLSLHTLLNQEDPRRNLLKRAIVSYINQRALRRDCLQSCPEGSFHSSDRRCICMCKANTVVNEKCCATERGRAYLMFYVDSASDLWGDHFSSTDAYVKFFFQNQERRTRIINGNNNPQWLEALHFGAVTLEGSDYFEVEIWDSDVWHDDLLQKCYGRLYAEMREEVWLKCHPSYGYVKFYYMLKCAPTLTGSSCHNYLPSHLPTSYFNDTNPHLGALSLSHRFRDQVLHE
ncbi:perforin-1-like isoform X2 [Python bivittatus]|uniref:Perforin-1-like isoform X2 n=1 Tax=Python bivittatus TaxID=176946 RepID=A0A9F5JAV1_PYTBI|nr:perforin-1-like isoform X2 [Python bivittatus]